MLTVGGCVVVILFGVAVEDIQRRLATITGHTTSDPAANDPATDDATTGDPKMEV